VVGTLFLMAMWALALAAAALALWRGKRPIPRALIVDQASRYAFLFVVGGIGVFGFAANAFYTEETARSTGWAVSPFQFDIAFAYLGLGVAGIYAAFRGFAARLAIGIFAGVFLIGAGLGQLRELFDGNALVADNLGGVVTTHFLTPLALFALLWLGRGQGAAALRVESAQAALKESEAALRALAEGSNRPL
jgi:hypothetical protein